jgi:hypothetical protein
VWDEFSGKDTAVLIVSPGPSFTSFNNISGVFGEIKGEANLFTTTSGLSGFVNAGVKWKTKYQESNVTLGFRYSW